MAEQQSFDRDLAKISRTPATSWTPETIHLAAASRGPNIIVIGTLEKKDATFFINLSAVRVSDGVVVETESFDMHISDFLDSLSSSAPGKDDDSVNHAGLNGIGMPSCMHCPDPSYSDFPRAGRVQGVVVFQVVISADGRAERLYRMKLIGYGLDENAYNAIKQWRFKPARDKSGVAVPCIVPIEVTSRLY